MKTESNSSLLPVACFAGVFFERAICSRKRHVETSRREEEMGKGYNYYSPQSSTIIKSKMAATTTLRTRARFRPPKIRLQCRLCYPRIGTLRSKDAKATRTSLKKGIFTILVLIAIIPTQLLCQM